MEGRSTATISRFHAAQSVLGYFRGFSFRMARAMGLDPENIRMDAMTLEGQETCTITLAEAMSMSDAIVNGGSFQESAEAWAKACFGDRYDRDKMERADRFLEEALELLQSLGYPRERIAELVDYVYGRPAGDPAQEMGGTMLTLALLAGANGLDAEVCAEVELERVHGKIEKIRAKQKSRVEGSALPGTAPEEAAHEP